MSIESYSAFEHDKINIQIPDLSEAELRRVASYLHIEIAQIIIERLLYINHYKPVINQYIDEESSRLSNQQ